MTGDVIAARSHGSGGGRSAGPRPGFAHVLGAAAGAFAVVAVVSFVVEVTGDDPTCPGVAFSAALAIAALVAGLLRVRARSGRRASPRSCSRSRSCGSSPSSATATAVVAMPRHLPADTRVLPGALPPGLDEGSRDLPRGHAPLVRELGHLRGRRERQQQRHPVPERGHERHRQHRSIRHLDRHVDVVEHVDDTTGLHCGGRARHRGRVPRRSARCSTGASSKARPLRSSRSARSRRSSARWCSARTRAR